MPRYYLARTQERSILPQNAPSYQLITNLFRATRAGTVYGPEDVPTPGPKWGNWVGPGPRVTRAVDGGASVTEAAWLYEFPDDAFFDYMNFQPATSLVTTLSDNLNDRFHMETVTNPWTGAQVRFGEVTLVPYRAEEHGPIEFWRSGQATNTRTRDSFLADVRYADENPVGPNLRGQGESNVPDFSGISTAAESAQRTVAAVGKTLLWGLGIAAIGGVVYLGATAYKTYRSVGGGSRKRARKNPRRLVSGRRRRS